MSHEILYPDSYDEEDKLHSIWWSDQMKVCKSVIAEIQKEISEKENVRIAGSHTATNNDGEHEVKVSVIVEGESFESRLEDHKQKGGEK